jgi:uncharacterized membrane protein
MRSRQLWALAGIVVAGGALRFATLDAQSYWLDEVATVNLLRQDFGDMISSVSAGESTPHLYYVIAWVWAKLFGTGEVGLRSLSALFGTAVIPVAYLLGRRLAGMRAGLIAAALCAFNPLLVWYSQEARAYSLLVLLSGLTLLATLSVLDRASPRAISGWALASIAVLATHYFAGFLVGAEALWLLWRFRRAPGWGLVLGGVAAVTAAALALLPLALHQRSTGAAAFISQTSLPRRLAQVPKQFAIGYQGPLEVVLTVVALLLIVYGVLRLIVAAPGPTRHRAIVIGAAGAAAVVAPAVLALIGPDYLLPRNLLAAWLPLWLAIAVGFATPRAPREGVLAAALLCAIGVVVVIATATNGAYQRDNWRAAAESLGNPDEPRAIVVTPASGRIPLLHYLDGASPVGGSGVSVKELDFVGLAPRLPGEEARPPRPGPITADTFVEFRRKQGKTYTVVRTRSAAGAGSITATVGASPLDGRPAVVLYQP